MIKFQFFVNNQIFRNMNGQSAIEYLMTYGWMLLAVSVVGGGIYSVVGGQSIESISGFNGDDVFVDDAGLTDDEFLMINLRNNGAEEVSINSINISSNEISTRWVGKNGIEVGSGSQIVLGGFEESNGANSFKIEINYDSGSLESLSSSGSLTADLALPESEVIYDREPQDTSQILSTMDGAGTSSDPYIVEDEYDLQAINADTDAVFEIQKDILAVGTENWNEGKGFNPLGDCKTSSCNPDEIFNGSIDGNGNEITDLHINRSDENYVGLVGYGINSTISNLSLEDVSIEGDANVGGVLGRSNYTNNGNKYDEIKRASVSGEIKGNRYVGGLAGIGPEVVANSSSTADIFVEDQIAGGIIGGGGGSIQNSYSLGRVQGGIALGGISGIGYESHNYTNSYSKGDVETTQNLVGGISGYVPSNSPQTKNVFWDEEAGISDSNADNSVGTPLQTSDLTGPNLASGIENNYDFGSVWSKNAEYLSLKWED